MQEQRAEYLSCMKAFRTDAQPLIDFFFHTAIDRMEREIAEKRTQRGISVRGGSKNNSNILLEETAKK